MMKKITWLILLIAITITSITEAGICENYLQWRINIKKESIKIERFIIKKIEQNKDKNWEYLKDTIEIWKG